MTALSICQTPREVWLVQMGAARGVRNAVMREARFSQIPSVLVRIAREWNRDLLKYKRLAQDAKEAM